MWGRSGAAWDQGAEVSEGSGVPCSPWQHPHLVSSGCSVASMSTLYVLSLRSEEDVVEMDGYVCGASPWTGVHSRVSPLW